MSAPNACWLNNMAPQTIKNILLVAIGLTGLLGLGLSIGLYQEQFQVLDQQHEYHEELVGTTNLTNQAALSYVAVVAGNKEQLDTITGNMKQRVDKLDNKPLSDLFSAYNADLHRVNEALTQKDVAESLWKSYSSLQSVLQDNTKATTVKIHRLYNIQEEAMRLSAFLAVCILLIQTVCLLFLFLTLKPAE